VADEYTQGTYAARRRWDKAHTLAAWAWNQGLTPDQTARYDHRQLATICAAAGVNPPRKGSTDTRALLLALLVVKTYWAVAHPGHPGAHRTVLTDEQAITLATPRRKAPAP
jgi:hypothetical protein